MSAGKHPMFGRKICGPSQGVTVNVCRFIYEYRMYVVIIISYSITEQTAVCSTS